MCLLVALNLMAASGVAQTPKSPARKPTFVLPAGSHALDELIAHVSQLRRAPIEMDEALRKKLHAKKVQTWRELQLPSEAFEDVANSLLLQRGIVVANEREENGRRRLRVMELASLDGEIADLAEKWSVDEVLARPGRAGFAVVTVPTGKIRPQMAFNMLRVLLAQTMGFAALQAEARADGVRLTGTTEQVAFAIRLIQHMGGTVPPTTNELPYWGDADGAKIRWAGGRCKLSELIAAAADRIGANLIRPDDQGGDPLVELGDPADCSSEQWFARLGNVLLDVGFHLTPLVAKHRVYELRCDGSVRRPRSGIWRALFTTPEAAKKRGDMLPVAVVYSPVGGPVAATNRIRPKLGAMREMVLGSAGPESLILIGPRHEVARALALVDGK